MFSRSVEFERRTLLVQFISVKPLTFYSTADGTDLVQDILRGELSRSDADILGQEGSLSLDDNGEFLSFEPTDTKNRALHLPIEHLAYCGALRRIRRDKSDERNQDQIKLREYENVDLANRYPQHITGPPIFVAIFHGFDNALCYTFVTQSSDDACILVLKLMKVFRQYEQKLRMQNQDAAISPINNNELMPSTTVISQGDPLQCISQASIFDNAQILSPPSYVQHPHTISNMSNQNLFSGQSMLSSSALVSPYADTLPTISCGACYPASTPATIFIRNQDTCVCCPSPYSIVRQENIRCDGSYCTQCRLPVSSSSYIIRDPLSLPDCY
ncbi:unnamed protein product [Rotaria magnacalcarata]|uniref:Uncharacterized protein n=1 Tax=Rotaria magnacalcarata TaxID=392030 RepID=A0A817AWF5_9BILA|nr:unnamed protein product [Rotaria magnacalcarata]CAF4063162.1 unnamed protein product [Rotaria magnacalcarata]